MSNIIDELLGKSRHSAEPDFNTTNELLKIQKQNGELIKENHNLKEKIKDLKKQLEEAKNQRVFNLPEKL